MRRNSFLVLAGLTALALGGAYFASMDRGRTVQTAPQRQLLFADLPPRLNDVTTVLVRAPGSNVTLQRDGDRWIMPEKFGHPVDFAKVRALLLQVARLETIEPRTAKPDLYSRLQVEDIDTPGAKSIQVTIRAKDEVLADLLVGRTRPAGEGGGVFVRDAAEEQAWLAKGDLRPDKDFVQWLQRDVVNVDQRRIQSVAIDHASGDQITIARPQPGSGDFTLRSPVPDGREPKAAYELSPLAGIADYLILEDVRPAGEVNADSAPVTATFRTYDGLTLTMKTVELDGKSWTRIAAATADPVPELAAYLEANKGKDTAEGRDAGNFKSPEEIAKEAEAINARVANWAYRLTDYKAGKLKSSTEDLTQEKKEAAAAPAPATSPSEAGAPIATDTAPAAAETAPAPDPAARQAGAEAAEPQKVN